MPTLPPSIVRYENDALSLEYELMYGCARGELDIADVVNDSALLREGGVLGPLFQEQLFDLFRGQTRSLTDDFRNSPLIRLNRI